MIKNRINKNLNLTIKPFAMKRALTNIISNAISYSKKFIEISAKTDKKYIIIYIEDDGEGIPKNKRPFLKYVDDKYSGIYKGWDRAKND